MTGHCKMSLIDEIHDLRRCPHKGEQIDLNSKGLCEACSRWVRRRAGEEKNQGSPGSELGGMREGDKLLAKLVQMRGLIWDLGEVLKHEDRETIFKIIQKCVNDINFESLPRERDLNGYYGTQETYLDRLERSAEREAKIQVEKRAERRAHEDLAGIAELAKDGNGASPAASERGTQSCAITPLMFLAKNRDAMLEALHEAWMIRNDETDVRNLAAQRQYKLTKARANRVAEFKADGYEIFAQTYFDGQLEIPESLAKYRDVICRIPMAGMALKQWVEAVSRSSAHEDLMPEQLTLAGASFSVAPQKSDAAGQARGSSMCISGEVSGGKGDP